jgi:hypothetical protein
MASEVLKNIKREIRSTGNKRFFLALSFIVAGTIWKVFQLGGDSAEGAVRKLISFWPIFWITWMAAGFLAWAFSGFKNMSALIFSLTGGAFMAETVMPGVIFNTENWPLFLILAGVLLFALPKRNLQANAYGYSYGGYGKGASKDATKSSRRTKKHRSKPRKEITDEHQPNISE